MSVDMISLCLIRTSLAVCFFASAMPAHAAHLAYQNHIVFGEYKGHSNGSAFSEALADRSIDDIVAISGRNKGFSSPLYPSGILAHGYDANGQYSDGNVLLSLEHGINVVGNETVTIAEHRQESLISLSSIALKVSSVEAAEGAPVYINFIGAAQAWYVPLSAHGNLQLTMSVSNGEALLAGFVWDVASSTYGPTNKNINFGFAANVGDDLIFTATIASRAVVDGLTSFPSYGFDEVFWSRGYMNGDFNVTAVPEPEQYALFLAGLGLIGTLARRKHV